MSTGDSAPAATSFVLRDPETFFHAQRRNRRATWRMSGLGVFAALIMGIPLTLALTPLVYAGTLIVAETVNHFSPLPPEFWQTANSLARLAARLANYVFNHRGTLDPQELVIALAVVLLPGIAIAFVLWVGMMALFRRGGVGGALASLNARDPNQADLKELQLADTAQEMAIAAGLPAPKLMLLDTPGANAAAIGTSIHDARIVISRRLIDDLSRDQLQALLGHLIASVGNGDLRVAFTVTSVFETCGLLVTLINSPFGSHSRGTLWRMVRYALFPSNNKAAEADAVCELLGGSVDMGSDDISRFFDDSQKKAGPIRKFLRFVFFPIVFTNISIEMTLWFFLTLLVGPCMALVWRTRRYLADAGAVELTRNPDALVAALQRLAEDNSVIAGGGWATHLFVINPSGDGSAGSAGPSPEQMRQAAAIWSTAGGGSVPAQAADYATLKREIMKTGMAAMQGDAAATARIQAFAQAMAAAHGEDASSIHMPNMSDLAAARQGDRAAIARMMAANQEWRSKRPAETKTGNTGLQAQSFLSFHPPLKKRFKRLERMGAHLAAGGSPTRTSFGAKVALTVLLLIIVPLLAVAGGLMLVVIAMMIGLNLIVLSIWLAVIHAIFMWRNRSS
jgi:Zn-dependent protease with chaperone function